MAIGLGALALAAAPAGATERATDTDPAASADREVTLDTGAMLQVRVRESALAAQLGNGGAVRTESGGVALTASALAGLATNSSRVIRATRIVVDDAGNVRLVAATPNAGPGAQ